MKKSYLIGIDAGVSFVKAGVYDVDGNCEGLVKKPRPGSTRALVFLFKRMKIICLLY